MEHHPSPYPPPPLLPPARILPGSKGLNTSELLQVFKRLPAYTRLVFGLYRSPDISHSQKMLLSAALGYLVSPIDLVPGFIPVAGQLDDMLIVLGILYGVVRSVPEEVSGPLLKKAGLRMEVLEGDLKACKRAAGITARKSAAVAGRAARLGFQAAMKAVHGANRIVQHLRSR